jgi:hypothetical protein
LASKQGRAFQAWTKPSSPDLAWTGDPDQPSDAAGVDHAARLVQHRLDRAGPLVQHSLDQVARLVRGGSTNRPDQRTPAGNSMDHANGPALAGIGRNCYLWTRQAPQGKSLHIAEEMMEAPSGEGRPPPDFWRGIAEALRWALGLKQSAAECPLRRG